MRRVPAERACDTASPHLDCLVIGFHDMPRVFELEALRPPDSAEYRIFLKNHVLIDGRRLSYMDVINHCKNKAAPPSGMSPSSYYHVGEVGSLAAIYLANYLNVRGLSAKFTGLFLPESENIKSVLVKEQPRSVAITTTFYESTEPVEEIVRFVRKHSPRSTLCGGSVNSTAIFLKLSFSSNPAAARLCLRFSRISL